MKKCNAKELCRQARGVFRKAKILAIKYRAKESWKHAREQMPKGEQKGLIWGGIIFGIVLAVVLRFNLVPTEAIQLIITFVLVSITAIYVKRTSDISKATREQADASVKMAKEMREQRIIASRPVIIQRAVYKDSDWPDIKIGWTGIIPNKIASHFSHFEVYNVGSGPAIEVEISVLDKEKRQIDSLESIRRTFLKADDHPLIFRPSIPSEGVKSYYIACEYQSVISRSSKQQTWYQTLLPFSPNKSSKQGEIYVATGKLEFREVNEKERIDAFSRKSKPR